ncbi:MAG: AraC family transcriptional regulator [Capsulimonadaceae bacterium]|nr:AraC family transcriptional regulator [Capsulimonadaceae bacterium]
MSTERLILLGASYNPSCNITIDKHLDGYYTLQFMEYGGVELSYDDRHSILEGAWYWPAYPGPHLRFHAAPGYDGWFHRHVGFSGALVFDWIAQGIWPTEAQSAPPGLEDGRLFDRIIAETRRGGEWGRRRAINLIEQLLIELAEARATRGEAMPEALPPWLQRVIDKITTSAPCNYDEIAASEGMCPSTLRRHFRRAMGLSLHKYVIRRRIETARILLNETDLPLKAIADALGYENQYFFSRQFREVAGVAPGVFRKSLLK